MTHTANTAALDPRTATLNATHALFTALGKPERRPLSEDPEFLASHELYGYHPVFPLAEIFAPGDRGYTANPYSRGGHTSTPCYVESQDVAVLEVSFHKGVTYVDLVEFPDGPDNVRAALYELMTKLEQRD